MGNIIVKTRCWNISPMQLYPSGRLLLRFYFFLEDLLVLGEDFFREVFFLTFLVGIRLNKYVTNTVVVTLVISTKIVLRNSISGHLLPL